jgi:hypothetical protein
MKKLLVLTLLQFAATISANFHNMIVILDWENERVSIDLNQKEPLISGFGAQTIHLATALVQEAAPILVSAATLKNFIERATLTKDFLEKNKITLQSIYLRRNYERFKQQENIGILQELLQEYFNAKNQREITNLENRYTQGKALITELEGFSIPYLLPIEPKNWDMYQVNEIYFLLIPKSYPKKINIRKQSKVPNSLREKISDQDWLLGLKISELKKVTTEQLYSITTFDDSGNFENFEKKFLEALVKVFITRTDVKVPSEETTAINEQRLPFWILYVSGHGFDTPSRIIGLTVETFQKFLRFLNNGINTTFAFFVTCFPGGKHLKIPYETKQINVRKIQQTIERFNYLIAVESFSFGVTSNYTIIPKYVPSYKPSYKSEDFEFPSNFNVFFKDIESSLLQGKPTLVAALATVSNFLKKEELLAKMQIPAIRYPGTEWFSIIDMPNKIFNLTSVKAQAAFIEKRPIKVVEKQALILYAQEPFEPYTYRFAKIYQNALFVPLIIKKEKEKKAPSVLTFAPGPAQFYFSSVDASSLNLTEVIEAFAPPIYEKEPRTYYIKNLKCFYNLEPMRHDSPQPFKQNTVVTLKDVIILFKAENPLDPQDFWKYNGILFSTEENAHYAALWKEKDTLLATPLLEKNKIPNLTIVQPEEWEKIKRFEPSPNSEAQKIIETLQKKQEEAMKRKKQIKDLSESLIQFKNSLDQLQGLLRQRK